VDHRRLLRVASVLTAVLACGLLWLAPEPHAAASTALPARITALAWAERQAGKPYLFGGTGPWGFDCSGLVQAAYARAGITLPRTTYQMLASGHLHFEPVSQARRGDLVFYGPGHVELKTRPWNGTFGALEPGTLVGWHRWSGWWRPTVAAWVS
jgi:cell wall-associated NlpC family hydrolase